jgi:hypothetical protein
MHYKVLKPLFMERAISNMPNSKMHRVGVFTGFTIMEGYLRGFSWYIDN